LMGYMMPSRRLLEVLLSADGEKNGKIAGLTDDVISSILHRSIMEGFGSLIDEKEVGLLTSVLESFDPSQLAVLFKERRSFSEEVFRRFRERTARRQIDFDRFMGGFANFLQVLDQQIKRVSAPKLMEMPCREFGILNLDGISSLSTPDELSGYMTGLVHHFRDLGALTPTDADYLIELVDKMASAPGYLRYLGRERKEHEIIRLFSTARAIQSSAIADGPELRDMVVTIGILLFNISPSEKIVSFLVSSCPSDASDALKYHYNAILALNYTLADKLDLASMFVEGALQATLEGEKTAYILILRGCIAIRQGDFDLALAALQEASAKVGGGRAGGLIMFYEGVVLFEEKKYANAIRCFEAAKHQMTDELDQVTLHNNIGSCAMLIGDVSRAEKEFLAMQQLSESLKGKHVNRCRLVANSYMGAIWQTRGDGERSIEHYRRALKIALSSNKSQAIVNQLGNLGISYATSGDQERALQMLNACMAYAERTGYWQGIKFAFWHTYDLLLQKNHCAEALRFHEKYTSKFPELKDL